jgi:hypothetical protein
MAARHDQPSTFRAPSASSRLKACGGAGDLGGYANPQALASLALCSASVAVTQQSEQVVLSSLGSA